MTQTDLVAFAKQQQDLGKEVCGAVFTQGNTFEKDGSYLLVERNANGVKFTEKTPKPAARAYVAESLDSIVQLTDKFATDRADKKIFVFVSQGGIVTLLDEDDRKERLSFDMRLSDAMCAIEGLADPTEPGEDPPYAFGQRDFIDFLRRKVNGEVEPDSLISSVRQVKFTKSDNGESKIQTGRESIGRQVEAEMTGADKIPDEVTISVPYYENVRDSGGNLFKVAVDFVLDTNIAEGKFLLRPKAGEIDRVREESVENVLLMIQKSVTAKNVRVFAGKPE